MDALFPLLVTFGLMWLLLIRPQQRRARRHQALISSLQPGDEVVTAGGIHGTVVAVEEQKVHVEVAPGVVLRLLRGAVSQRTSSETTADPMLPAGDDRAAEDED